MKTSLSGVSAENFSADDFSLKVDAEDRGIRVDQFVSQILPQMSRSLVAEAIRQGSVQINGMQKKCSYRLKEGDLVCGEIAEKPQQTLKPQKVPFSILFEDDDILLLSKPPGIVVHPGSGNEDATLVHGLLYHCGALKDVGEELRPGIVHRLDKDTSGIMVVAKTSAAHRELVRGFKNREVEKEYLTLVHGTPREGSGRLVAPIGRHPVNRKKMAVRSETGRFAASRWQVVEVFGNVSLLKVVIESGRTHQIRVHMAHLGCPVVGDDLYGSRRENHSYPRQMLHAWRLALFHPVSGVKIEMKAPLWEDFEQKLCFLGWEGQL